MDLVELLSLIRLGEIQNVKDFCFGNLNMLDEKSNPEKACDY
mgnify:FL=1